jgi:hypothetical protein
MGLFQDRKREYDELYSPWRIHNEPELAEFLQDLKLLIIDYGYKIKKSNERNHEILSVYNKNDYYTGLSFTIKIQDKDLKDKTKEQLDKILKLLHGENN